MTNITRPVSGTKWGAIFAILAVLSLCTLVTLVTYPGCATTSSQSSRNVVRDGLTALAMAVPLLDQADQEAYRKALAAADAKDYPALAAAEASRAEAIKSFERILTMARRLSFQDSVTKEQKVLLVTEVLSGAASMLRALSSGPLPTVNIPAGFLVALDAIKAALNALVAGATDGGSPADAAQAPGDSAAAPGDASGAVGSVQPRLGAAGAVVLATYLGSSAYLTRNIWWS